MAKRRIISFELLPGDKDILQAFENLPSHITKSGLIRLALRAYLGQEQHQTFMLTVVKGDVKEVDREVTDLEVENLLDSALENF